MEYTYIDEPKPKVVAVEIYEDGDALFIYDYVVDPNYPDDPLFTALDEAIEKLPFVEEVYIDANRSSGFGAPYCPDSYSWGPWNSYIITEDGEEVPIEAKGCADSAYVNFDYNDHNYSIEIRVMNEEDWKGWEEENE